jgi:hypothetical protein
MQWLIFPEENHVEHRDFKSAFPHSRLREDEILLANVFTFERCRRMGVNASAIIELCKMARSKGFKRMITDADSNNIPALKSFEKAGYKKFAKVRLLRLFFSTKWECSWRSKTFQTVVPGNYTRGIFG